MVDPRSAVLDVLAVLVFVGVGRLSHADGITAAGLAETAWPFGVALAAGWVVAASTGRRTDHLVGGAAVWVSVVAGGLGLRAASGGGTAPSFVVVTAVVLAVLLLGWRVAVAALARRRPPGAA